MKTNILPILLVLFGTLTLTNCTHDNYMKLEPLAGVSLKIPGNNQKSAPLQFDATVTILTNGEPWQTKNITFDLMGGSHYATSLLEVPFNKSFVVRMSFDFNGGQVNAESEPITLSEGTAPSQISLIPSGYGTVTDFDGSTYPIVLIGWQWWMAENLKTTVYSDGTAIPTGYSDLDWAALNTGAYAVYPHAEIDGLNSDAEVLDAYGALYNWYAVETGNLCPTGWRVPTDEEWTTLTDYVGGESVAGGKLKSTRTAPDAHPRWGSPNTGATDEYGFSALPGGTRYGSDGTFLDVGSYGRWWSGTEFDAMDAWGRAMGFDYGGVFRAYDTKRDGDSVRCVRDN